MSEAPADVTVAETSGETTAAEVEVEVVPPPGTPFTSAREIVSAKGFNSKKGTEYDVPDATIAAVEAFKSTPGVRVRSG